MNREELEAYIQNHYATATPKEGVFMVAGHLREQNGLYQIILSYKDGDGKRETKSISTGYRSKATSEKLRPC